jgi:tetratricopeptide (TPR) repeat protein
MQDSCQPTATTLAAISLTINHAASLMENGDFQEAIDRLTNALKVSKQFDGTIGRRTNLDQYMRPGQSLTSQLDQPCYFYQQAVYFPLSTDSSLDSTESSLESKTCLSVILLFNLALCHHLSAMKSFSKILLRKAAVLYALALDLASEMDMDTLFFSMATINNLGHIHDVLGDAETATECFTHLLSILIFQMHHDRAFQVSGLDGFFRNTSYLILLDHTADAA